MGGVEASVGWNCSVQRMDGKGEGWYTLACYACAMSLHKLQTHFLKMRICLDGTANTCHTVAAIAHGKPNFVSFCINTK